MKAKSKVNPKPASKSKHRFLKVAMTTLGVAGLIAAFMKVKGRSRSKVNDKNLPTTPKKAKSKKKKRSHKAA